MRWKLVITYFLSECRSKSLTIERGDNVLLKCIDDKLEEQIKQNADFEGKRRDFSLLIGDKNQNQQPKIFEYSVGPDGVVDSESIWTAKKYFTDKFQPSDDGKGIIINDVTLDDEGDFICRISIRRSTFDQIEEFSITVLVAPLLSSPNSNEITETHSQNYEVVGYCTAKNSKPASVITWIAPPDVPNKHIKIEPTTMEEEYKTYTTKSILRLVPSRNYNNQKFICKISHPTLPDGQQKYSLNISVQYPPTEPQITPYFKSGLLNCVADGNPRPKLTWRYFPSREPTQIKTYANSPKFRIPDDNVNYNFSCIASNKHGTKESTISSVQLDRHERFLEANLNIIVGAGIASIITLILIAFFVCRYAIKSTKKKYKNHLPLPSFPTDNIHLHHDQLGDTRPTPPRSKPPEISDSEADEFSFEGGDVDISNDPFVRSHSILQGPNIYQKESFEHAMSDVYPIKQNDNQNERHYDYQPSYSNQNTHRFTDIPKIPKFEMERNRIDDVLQVDSHYADYAPIDARQNSTHYHQVAHSERSERSLRHQPDNNYLYGEDNVV